MYTGLSAIFFYLSWRGNGLADLYEIWQVGPSYGPVVRCAAENEPQTFAFSL